MCKASPPNVRISFLREGRREERLLEFHQAVKISEKQFQVAMRFLAGEEYELLRDWMKDNFPKEYQNVAELIESSIRAVREGKAAGGEHPGG